MTSPTARDRYGRYAVEIGGKNVAPSVSTVLGLLNKDGLSWGAAKETALYAIHHYDEWKDLHSDEAYTKLRGHHKGVWDDKAAIGTLGHSVAELWTAGEAVDLEVLVTTSDVCRKRKWSDQRQVEIADKLGGYVDALERFWSEQEPEFEQVERSVVCPGVFEDGYTISRNFNGVGNVVENSNYAGTFDARGRLKDGKDRRIDWKGLALDTPIPTPAGWTTMGQLQAGDTIFGSDGNPCLVIAKSEVHWRTCMRITFDDRTSIICDDEHRWLVKNRYANSSVLETQKAREYLDGRSYRVLNVTNAKPLELSEIELPVPPYVLGAWLGDGKHTSGEITTPDAAIWARIEELGFTLGSDSASTRGQCRTHTVIGLVTALRTLGVCGHKHVPDIYMRGSVFQRLELLRGLMDTDGTWNKKRKRACFDTTDKGLAESVRELVVSLGWKAIIHEFQTHGFGLFITAYRVDFSPFDMNPFHLPRKAELVRIKGSARANHRGIRSIEEVPTVATQCITVDSPDNTYLCGEQMVPTHNTGSRYPIETTLQLAAYDFAPYLGIYDAAGKLIGLEPNTRAEVCSIVYLHDDGTYELLDLPVNQAAWERFIELRRTKSWLSDMDKWLKANPEPEREVVE